MEAYCMKCKAHKVMVEPKPVTLKNGRDAVQGNCTDCNTKMFKMGSMTPAAK